MFVKHVTADKKLLSPYPRTIFLVHETGENVEDLFETARCIDPMEAFLSAWCGVLCKHGHLLDECRVELQEVLDGDSGEIEDSNLSGNDKVVVFIQHVV
jgi:hypothetical protein